VIDKYKIDIIPLDVLLGGTNCLDSITLSPPQLFQLVAESRELRKTAEPSISFSIEHFTTPKEGIYQY